MNEEVRGNTFEEAVEAGVVSQEDFDVVKKFLDTKTPEMVRECSTIRVFDGEDKDRVNPRIESKSPMMVLPGGFVAFGAVAIPDAKGEGEFLGSMNVDMMEGAYDTEEEMFDHVISKVEPVLLEVSKTILADEQPVNLFENDDEIDAEEPFLILTTKDGRHGSSAAAVDGIFEKIADRVGSYWLIPSSVHEFLVVPEELDEEEVEDRKYKMNGMLMSGNMLSCEPKDVLAHHVRYYDKKTGMLAVEK